LSATQKHFFIEQNQIKKQVNVLAVLKLFSTRILKSEYKIKIICSVAASQSMIWNICLLWE